MNTNRFEKKILKTFERFNQKYDRYEVFSDFIYMAAAALSNAVDKVNFEVREKEYLRRINKYTKEEQALFPELIGDLVMCFEVYGPNDYLGRIFMELGLGNGAKGQFFTPYDVSLLMAKITITKESVEKHIAEKGYFTLYEPTCGAGGMVIAAYQVVHELGFNPQKVMRVVSQDVDIRAVLMTFIQTTLLGLDNSVILGNTLLCEELDVWRTPGRFLRLLANLNSSTEQPKEISEVTQLDLFSAEDFTEINDEGQLVLAF